MNLKINLGGAPPSMHRCTGMLPGKGGRGGCRVFGVKKITPDASGGFRGTALKEMKLPFCSEICKGSVPLAEVILPWTCCYVLCRRQFDLQPRSDRMLPLVNHVHPRPRGRAALWPPEQKCVLFVLPCTGLHVGRTVRGQSAPIDTPRTFL